MEYSVVGTKFSIYGKPANRADASQGPWNGLRRALLATKDVYVRLNKRELDREITRFVSTTNKHRVDSNTCIALNREMRSDDSGEVRKKVLEAFASKGEKGKLALRNVVDDFKEFDDETKLGAVDALGRMGAKDELIWPVIGGPFCGAEAPTKEMVERVVCIFDRRNDLDALKKISWNGWPLAQEHAAKALLNRLDKLMEGLDFEALAIVGRHVPEVVGFLERNMGALKERTHAEAKEEKPYDDFRSFEAWKLIASKGSAKAQVDAVGFLVELALSQNDRERSNVLSSLNWVMRKGGGEFSQVEALKAINRLQSEGRWPSYLH